MNPPPAAARLGEQCYCLAARRAARKLTRLYDEVFRPLDLSGGQFSMLAAIGGMQPVSVTALADYLAMDRTTVTAALKPLLRRDLVQQDDAAHDRRSRLLRLTTAGDALRTQAERCWQQAQQRVEQELGAAPARALRASLAMLG